jgi:tRNA threonylcarbamoyl adenosine modification protein YeaZ
MVLGRRRIAGERGHAQFLIPLLDELLTDAALSYRDVERIAVTTGPGSFTGIRVGLAAAQGLAMVLDVSVIGVTVFDAVAAAVAEAGNGARNLLVALESRRTEIFAQQFNPEGRALGDPTIAPAAEIAARARPIMPALAGDAAHRLLPYLEVGTDSIIAAEVDPVFVAKLAAGRVQGPSPAPFYLRPADAKPRRS